MTLPSYYRSRTYQLKKSNRSYRYLIGFLMAVIFILFGLLLSSASTKAGADEYVLTSYESVQLMPGDTLWSLAETYKLSSMDTRAYIKTVKQINNLTSSDLISGEYLVLPVYSYPTD